MKHVNFVTRSLPNGSWEVKKTYNSIERFLSENKYRNAHYSKYKTYHTIKNRDMDYVYRAVFLKDLHPLKSKFDYQNIAEYEIHILLLKLQNEFYLYDMRVFPVQLWFDIRLKNTMLKINQIRLRRFYFKPLEI